MKPDRVPRRNPLSADLDWVLARLERPLSALRGRRIFITGGTGFIGTWLLECLAWANQHLDLGVSALILSRNPDSFLERKPHLALNPGFKFHQGDVQHFDFPSGRFSQVLHLAATPAEATFRNVEPLAKLDLQERGMRRTLDFALHCGAEQVFFASSGCVYGTQPWSLTHIPEDFPGAPDPLEPAQALGHGKRMAEFLSSAYAAKHGLEVKIARGFSFVGPGLQMDLQYAIGNFILNVLRGENIQVRGDGTQRRSYLYAADLLVWLWTIFLEGRSCRPYNVGSELDLSIKELAETVARTLGAKGSVEIAGFPQPGQPSDRYVPCTLRARSELGLEEYTDLSIAIVRTAEYCAQSGRF